MGNIFINQNLETLQKWIGLWGTPLGEGGLEEDGPPTNQTQHGVPGILALPWGVRSIILSQSGTKVVKGGIRIPVSFVET